MAGLNLYFSNRMEVLSEQLSDSTRKPLSDSLQSETIIVQNHSMERWICMQLAMKAGRPVFTEVRFALTIDI
jgi:exonuclease V gamma subunit